MKNSAWYKMYYQVSSQLGYDMHSDKTDAVINALLAIKRLAKKHHRLAEMDCNGEGVVRGVHYYNGTIDDYAKRTYGSGVKSAYVEDDVSVFDVESDKVQDKIKKLADSIGLVVEFHGDPRGNTVKLETKDGKYIDLN